MDISGYVGKARFVVGVKNSAGSSPTLTRKLQGSSALTRGLVQTTAGATDTNIKTSSTVNTLVGLKFTQAAARSIKRVAFQIKKQGTLAAGKKLTLALYADNAGAPAASATATAGTVDIDTVVTTSYAWVVFTFANPVDLADATVYHFVLSADYTASASNSCLVRSLTVASGGTLETKTDTTWSVTATESVEVYVDQYAFADITGGSFTQATDTVDVNESKEFEADQIPPIVRIYDTIGGTSNPAFYAGAHVVADRSVSN